MTKSTSATPQSVKRGRRMLIALAVLFFGSMLLAGVLRFSGWQPASMRNQGELLKPPADLRALVPVRANGQPYAWAPSERIWRIAVAPPADCTQQCVALAAELDKVWQLLGHRADKVEVLWIGTPPAGLPPMPELRVLRDDARLRQALSRGNNAAGVPVYVIDPNGFVILRYAPGFDPAGLRSDLVKLLKLM
jgi:cytochrome oxidase Cu insertion factor (SCO1/SenC/PrrC family)